MISDLILGTAKISTVKKRSQFVCTYDLLLVAKCCHFSSTA